MKNNFFEIKIVQNIYLLILMWYAFFASSTNVLRPFASIVWPFLAIISFGFNQKMSLRISKLSLAYLLMVGCLFLNLFVSQDYTISFEAASKLILYLVIGINISRNDKMRSNSLKIAYIFLMIHLSIVYLQIFFPNLFLSIFLDYIPETASYLVIKRVTSGVAIGFNTQTGIASFWFTLGLAFSISNFVSKKTHKFLNLAISFLFAGAVLLTSKRIFLLISILIVLFAFLINTNKKNRFFKLLVISFVTTLLFYMFASIFPNLLGVFDKISSFVEDGDISNGRFDIYKVAIDLFLKNKLFGIGYGTFATVSGLGLDAHNSFLQILTEFGIIGFIFFWVPFIKSFCLSFKSIKSNYVETNNFKNASKTVELIAFLSQIIFFMWCLTGNPVIDDTVLFIFLWMQMVSISIVKEKSISRLDNLDKES